MRIRAVHLGIWAVPTVLALGVGSAASAAAPAKDAVNTFRNSYTGRCIDDSEVGFRTFPCNGSNFQKWNVHVFNDGSRQLRNIATGRCMDDSTQGFRTVAPCHPGSNSNVIFQSFFVKRQGDGSISLLSQATRRCIDDSEVGFRTFPCNDLSYQRWS